MKMISPSNREVDIRLDPLGYDDNAHRIAAGGVRRLSPQQASIRHHICEQLTRRLHRRKPPAHTSLPTTAVAPPRAEDSDADLIVGADGANSRVAKAMDAGDYNVAIAFQERIKLPPRR